MSSKVSMESIVSHHFYMITLNIIAVFRLLEITDFCILLSTHLPLIPNSFCHFFELMLPYSIL